jgi:hypothetical protein
MKNDVEEEVEEETDGDITDEDNEKMEEEKQ